MDSSIPGPARDFVRAITQAVGTAISGNDVATYDRAIAQLATQPAAGRVLGDLLRSLLEDVHPNGFDSDDITLLVGWCYRTAAAWLPPERVDVITLLAALAGALGIHEPGITYEALRACSVTSPGQSAWVVDRAGRSCWTPRPHRGRRPTRAPASRWSSPA